MFRVVVLALAVLFAPLVASAQDATPQKPRAILVLDASGSMWGQIDGVNKIVIAREVIGGLLTTLPDDLELGLMAYGHRRKGDCADIELLQEPGTNRAAIAAAVDGLNPKGKTPLSAAVIEAAEALKYTEEAATVILVSDGIETCHYDPCAVGRELEAAGVDFTAHVIGFDVADPAARAQLQCLADETGGSFRTAANAEELAQALELVAAPPPPPPPAPDPVTAEVTFRALDGEAGATIESGLVWSIGMDGAGLLLEGEETAQPALTLPEGSGRAIVFRLADEARAEAMFTISGDGDQRVTVVLPELLPAATLDAPATAPAGSLVPVSWSGPNEEGDYLTSAAPETGGSDYIEYVYLSDGDGATAQLRMPPRPGQYEIRYVLTSGNTVLARRAIEVTPLDITLTPPEGARIGMAAQAGWRGPDYQGDYLAVSRPGSDDGQYESYEYTAKGSPLTLTMPAEPGDYELRYVLGASTYVAARVAFSVADSAATLDGPAEAPAGARIAVGWTGPNAENDYVSIARLGDRDGKYEGYSYTSDGSPLELALPMEPGDYELRYVLSQDTTVLARAPITLTPVPASLDAPISAPVGSEIAVTWSGPDYDRDYVAIAPTGADDGSYLGYAYTGNGNPARFDLPIKPGSYELRYVANDNGKKVLARRPLEVTEVGASLDAPASGPAGGSVSVGWSGPGGEQDYIALSRLSDGTTAYVSYSYLRNGSPVSLDLPTKPGSYELRYVIRGTDSAVLVRQPFEVTPVSASLAAPEGGPAGGKIMVAFTGPSYDQDMITIAAPNAGATDYRQYEYARAGSPLELALPNVPGTYELRYVLRGVGDAVVLATQPFEVTAVSASLEAPDSVPAGGPFSVTFTGPNYRSDLITIARTDATPLSYRASEYAREMSPVSLDAPAMPGSYELRYVLREGGKDMILARRPIEVAPVAVTLDAPGSVDAASTLTVAFDGPGYRSDFVVIARPDDKIGTREKTAYPRDGSPLTLDVPLEAGDWELRYLLGGSSGEIVARRPLSVVIPEVSLSAPATARAGSEIEVAFEGAGYGSDFIVFARPDDPSRKRVETAYPRNGSPVTLDVPDEPGAWELRYLLGGSGGPIVARQSVMVE